MQLRVPVAARLVDIRAQPLHFARAGAEHPHSAEGAIGSGDRGRVGDAGASPRDGPLDHGTGDRLERPVDRTKPDRLRQGSPGGAGKRGTRCRLHRLHDQSCGGPEEIALTASQG